MKAEVSTIREFWQSEASSALLSSPLDELGTKAVSDHILCTRVVISERCHGRENLGHGAPILCFSGRGGTTQAGKSLTRPSRRKTKS